MIGKPEWFGRRKYSGWGITPKTWQGWVYLAAILVPVLVFQALPFWPIQARVAVMVAWGVFLSVDITDIMLHLKKDEREATHEAIAERNTAWFMVAVLAVGLAYELARNAVLHRVYVNPFIATALIGGVIVKLVSNIYLERKA